MIIINVILERQSSESDCGVSSLLMIIKYYGGTINKEYLRVLTNTTNKGTTAYNLITASNSIGLTGTGVEGDVLSLNQRDLPCICHIINNNMYHFSVISNIDYNKKIITILDPDLGKRVLSYNEYKKISTNKYILFKVEKPLPVYKEKNYIFNIVKKNISNNLNLIINVIFLSIIYLIVNIVFIYRFKFVSDFIINYSNTTNLKLIIILLIIILIIKNITNSIKNKILLLLKRTIDLSLITSIFEKILSLPYLYYHNKSSGEILTRIQETQNLSDIIINVILSCIDILLLIVSSIVLYNLSSKLFMILCLFILIILLINLFYKFILKNKMKLIKISLANLNSKLVEYIAGIETINNYNINNFICNKLCVVYDNYISYSYNYSKSKDNEMNIINLIIDIVLIVILVSGIDLVIKGNLSLSSFITFDSIIYYMINPINNIMDTLLKVSEFKIIKKRINDLLNLINENELKESIKLEGQINIKNMTYKYNNKALITNLNLKINVGDKILIKGKSGTGKSTLLKIISGFINNYSGVITYNNINKSNIPNDVIRNNILYVSQQDKIFNDSIYNNIALGKSIDYKDFLEIINLCKIKYIKGNAKKFKLEEDGFNISGGERNRLILARSLVSNYFVYLYDETFNELDEQTRNEVLTNIFKRLKSKTIIVVSHTNLNENLFSKVINFEY